MRVLVMGLGLLLAGCPRSEPEATRTRSSSSSREARDVARAASTGSASPGEPAAFSERVAERRRLVETWMQSRDIVSEPVLRALSRVPRHHFVPSALQSQAYEDRPLPIGSGQTISQPYIVAFMTQAVAPEPRDRCLEIGTGSGYQAAVLAELCAQIFSIEYLPDVARQGAKNLRTLGYGPDRVRLRVGDGYRGWPEAAPFQVIVVTAAPKRVPVPLLDQLAVGGRLIIPVGAQGEAQELQRWTRRLPGSGSERFQVEDLMAVSFVPFLGEPGR